MKIYKHLLLSLLIHGSSLYFASGTAMDWPGKQEVPQQDTLTPPAFFSATEEMCSYGESLRKFATTTKDMEKVVAIAQIDPPIKFAPIILSDFELYLYDRTFALASSLMEIAFNKKAMQEPEISQIYHQKAIDSIHAYLQKFEGVRSKVESCHHRMLFHRSVLNQMLGNAYNSLISILSESSARIELMKMPVNAFTDSLTAAESLSFVNHGSFAEIESIIPNIKFGLLQAYCNQVQLLPRLFSKSSQLSQDKLLSQARSLRNDLKTNPKLYSEAHKLIAMAEKDLSASKKYIYKGGKRLQELKALKAEEEILDKYRLADQLVPSFQTTFLKKRQQLLVDLQKLEETKIIEKVKKIEEAVAQHLKISSQDNLEKIYAYYRKLIRHDDSALQELERYIISFIRAADLKGAERRAKVLLHLAKDNGKHLYLAKLVYAGVKNLQGEPEFWLSLEKELEDKAQKVKDRKKAAKQRVHKKKVELIAESKKESSLTETRSASDKKALLSPTPKTLKEAKESQVTTFAVEQTPSKQEAKRAKQKRHEEAEMARAEQESHHEIELRESAEEEASVSESVNRAEAQELELQRLLNSSDLKLSELYSLTGLPLTVDQEIEQATWRFTRGELQAYFEAMGCIYRPISSNHRKIDLPPAIHIMRDNEVLTIFNEFGGALTLPTWEKKYVPLYLRKQILAARKKLHALGIRARMTGGQAS